MAVSGQFLLLMAIIKKIKLPNEATARDIGANSSNIIYDGDAGTTTTLNSKIQSIFTAIGDINSFEIAVVNALPTENIDDHTIYFVPQEQGSTTHDEYMYINNQWELIGTTTIDLSDYLQKTDIIIAQGLTTGIPTATITVGDTTTTLYAPEAITLPAYSLSMTGPTIFFTSDVEGEVSRVTLPIYDGTII